MKILVAPNAFKGTYTPRQVAEAIAFGIKRFLPDAEIVSAPLADGGDGTIDVVHECLGGNFVAIEALDAVGQAHQAHWLNAGGASFLELSSICGLGLLGDRRAPLVASTYGLGQVLRQCLERSPNKIYITVGGSASTDGGAGALEALGAKFYDIEGRILPRGGGALVQLHRIDLSTIVPERDQPPIEILVDVNNPLLGSMGAARVYGGQKGASAEQMEILEAGLTTLADRLEKTVGLKLRNIPGAGAAGGTAFGLAIGLGAGIVSGADRIAELVKLEEKVKDCDLVVSAEGRFDHQSLMGKATGSLLKLCHKHGRPLLVIAASIDPDFNWQECHVEKAVPCTAPGGKAEFRDIATAVGALF